MNPANAHPATKSGTPLRVPIVLGITGHREIHTEHKRALRETVEEIFSELKQRHPHSPLRILSSLAPGADQLVAEVAEAHGVEIVAPLPFPPALYETSSTFENFPEALAQFQRWMACGKVNSFVVPLPQGPESGNLAAWGEFVRDPTKCHHCYANVGGYVVRHCHALIGLWNGKVSGLSSGTEEMVEYKLRGQRPAFYPWRAPLGQAMKSARSTSSILRVARRPIRRFSGPEN